MYTDMHDNKIYSSTITLIRALKQLSFMQHQKLSWKHVQEPCW